MNQQATRVPKVWNEPIKGTVSIRVSELFTSIVTSGLNEPIRRRLFVD